MGNSRDKVGSSVSPLFGLEMSPELVIAPAVHDVANYSLRRVFGGGDVVGKVHGGERRRMVVAERREAAGRGGGGAAMAAARHYSGEQLLTNERVLKGDLLHVEE